MKTNFRHLTGLVSLSLALPATAATFYSNFQNIPIPTDFTGVTVNVADGTLNPFFGGVGVANNDLLQPLRAGTGNLDTLLNLAVGTTIDAGSLYLSTGYGGSMDHLGSTFTAGQEGYVGFMLNGTSPGWMRVVFTANTGGAVVKDWAYDTGGSIAVGRIQQSATSGGAQTVTLSPATGEAFTLGSQITDTGGNTNSVVKTGGGTVTLTGTNSYGGATAVNAGKLLVNGAVSGIGTVTVASGGTLGGSGTINGLVIVNGVLSPGASIESLATGALTISNGASLAAELDSSAAADVNADLVKVSGNLALSGTVTLDLSDSAAAPAAFAPGTTLTLINYAGTWNGGFFTSAGNELANGETFTAGLNQWRINYDAISGGLNFATDYSAGHFVTLTAVPEPAPWLGLSCMLGSGALLRRRKPNL